MQILRLVKCLMFLLIVALLSACGSGGGSGNTSGALVLSLPTSVAAGTAMTATATLSSTSGRPLNNLKVEYVSDNQNVIPNVTDSNGTSPSGVSQVSLSTKNVLPTVATVKIYAVVDGVRSNSVTVTVNPAKLTLTPPADTIIPITADSTTKLCPGGIMRLVISGAQIKFSDSSGVGVNGQPVTIAVTSLTNGISSGDQVVLYPSGASTVTIPPYPNFVTSNTDNNGIWFLPVTIDGVSPTVSGGQHVFTVNWQASAKRLGDEGDISYSVTGQTMLTISCN
ncbi:MAG: hypothetical protein WC156_08495 [Pedobacter sp.]